MVFVETSSCVSSLGFVRNLEKHENFVLVEVVTRKFYKEKQHRCKVGMYKAVADVDFASIFGSHILHTLVMRHKNDMTIFKSMHCHKVCDFRQLICCRQKPRDIITLLMHLESFDFLMQQDNNAQDSNNSDQACFYLDGKLNSSH